MTLQARIGPLGQLYDAPFQTDVPAAERFGKVLDFVVGHGFPVYGLTTKTRLHHSQLPTFSTCARQAGLEVHCITHTHPMDSPAIGRRLHASAAMQAQRLRHARSGGMATLTLLPPKAGACTLDEFAREVATVRDQFEDRHDLRVMNGPPGRLVATVEDLTDFCRQAQVSPTVHVSHDYFARGSARSIDEWKAIVGSLPPEPLLCYANYRVLPGSPPRLTIYNDDSDATPPIRPLLEAAFARAIHPTILVQGDRPEADALGVLRAAAAVEGADLAAIQHDLKLTRLHRRVATVAAESVAS
jgi:hypothetical protein